MKDGECAEMGECDDGGLGVYACVGGEDTGIGDKKSLGGIGLKEGIEDSELGVAAEAASAEEMGGKGVKALGMEGDFLFEVGERRGVREFVVPAVDTGIDGGCACCEHDLGHYADATANFEEVVLGERKADMRLTAPRRSDAAACFGADSSAPVGP